MMDGSNKSMFFPQMQHYQSYPQQMMNSQMDVIDQKPVGLADQFGMDTGKKPAKPSKRKKKVKESVTIKTEVDVPDKKNMKQGKITEHLTVRKKRDRFNGMPEEDVAKRTLPDHLAENLDIVIIGINPGLFAAYVGHHYAGPGNHFWKCLYLSGLIPEPMNANDDAQLLDFGIGFTNIVGRTTRGSADLKKEEIKEGAEILKSKLIKYKPKIAVFNGKGIYEIFLGHKNFYFGKQPAVLEGSNTVVYVMPSSSARCAQLPRAVDKLPFFSALKKLRDHLRGDIHLTDDSEVTFPDLELKNFKQEKVEPVEGEEATSQPPTSKKRKRTKKPAPADDLETGQTAGWPAVKQENGFNPVDYGQASAVNPVSSAASAAQSSAKSLYMNFSQANGMVPASSGINVPVTSTNSTASGNGGTFGELHTMQPMQQFFSPGSFLQQLQAPLHPDQSQGMQFNNGLNWQQYGTHPFYQNLAMIQPQQHGHPGAGFPAYSGQQNMQQPAPAHQQSAQMPVTAVKTEPHCQGYEGGKQQESHRQQQGVPQNQPPLQHMQQQQHQSFLQQNQQGYFQQMHQPQKQQTGLSLPQAVVKSEPRESGYECALGAMASFVQTSQAQSSQSLSQVPPHGKQRHSPTHTNQNQQNQQEPPPLTHMQHSPEQMSNQQSFVTLSPQSAGDSEKSKRKETDYNCALSCSRGSPVQQQSAQDNGQQQQQPLRHSPQQHSPTHLPFTVKSEPQDQGYECAMNSNSS